MNKEDVLKKLKLSYLAPFAIIVNIFVAIFLIVPYFTISNKQSIPMYLKLFLIFWCVCSILSIIQERRSNKVTDSIIMARIYLIINILGAYILPLAFGTIYVFAAELFAYKVFDKWLELLLYIVVSWLGMHIFLKSEFKIGKLLNNVIFRIIGVVLIIGSFVYIIRLGFAVPEYDAESKRFILFSIVPLIVAHSYIVRAYFNYGLYLEYLKDDSEQEEVAK
ncbi:DUF5079 family protein [Mammaliicoccus sp. Dog046]|uniref:DUF5079 family protein n=1 Tax=Mammaliicoccus sp. Dog046 TaxID=3034233 RepID=UPI002B257697|nr:DUF5079 family protein [Mammaliicoccus sp. Dog046]WQK85588.1 DUF5079 family protein [Mammaliicoccus sp. Dog046]